MKRIGMILSAVLFSTAGLSAYTVDSSPRIELDLKYGQWDPASANMIGSLLQSNLINSVLLSGTFIAPEGTIESNEVGTLPMVGYGVNFSFGTAGGLSRGNVRLGYATAKQSETLELTRSSSNSDLFGIVQSTSQSEGYSYNTNGKAKNLNLGYDHEIYFFDRSFRWFQGFGAVVGVNLSSQTFDQARTKFLSTVSTVTTTSGGSSNTTTTVNPSNIVPPTDFSHDLYTATALAGLIWRVPVTNEIEIDTRAVYHYGTGLGALETEGITLANFGNNTQIPQKTESKYAWTAVPWGWEYGLGVTYKFSSNFAMRLAVDQRDIRFQDFTVQVKQGAQGVEIESAGPLPSGRDYASAVGLQFQFMF